MTVACSQQVSTSTEYQSPDTLAPRREPAGYIEDVKYYYGGTPPISNNALIEFGDSWCEALRLGMLWLDVDQRINEGAIDNDDAKMHRAIAVATVQNNCQDQQYKLP
jgi:hypothetical protein